MSAVPCNSILVIVSYPCRILVYQWILRTCTQACCRSWVLYLRGNVAAHQALHTIKKLLVFYHSCFCVDQTNDDTMIVPVPSLDPNYDAVIASIHQLEKKFNDYIEQQRKELKCAITFVGTGITRYHILFSDSCIQVQSDWVPTSRSPRKGFIRCMLHDLKKQNDRCRECSYRSYGIYWRR